jgi:hypothetical protein
MQTDLFNEVVVGNYYLYKGIGLPRDTVQKVHSVNGEQVMIHQNDGHHVLSHIKELTEIPQHVKTIFETFPTLNITVRANKKIDLESHSIDRRRNNQYIIHLDANLSIQSIEKAIKEIIDEMRAMQYSTLLQFVDRQTELHKQSIEREKAKLREIQNTMRDFQSRFQQYLETAITLMNKIESMEKTVPEPDKTIDETIKDLANLTKSGTIKEIKVTENFIFFLTHEIKINSRAERKEYNFGNYIIRIALPRNRHRAPSYNIFSCVFPLPYENPPHPHIDSNHTHQIVCFGTGNEEIPNLLMSGDLTGFVLTIMNTHLTVFNPGSPYISLDSLEGMMDRFGDPGMRNRTLTEYFTLMSGLNPDMSEGTNI